MENGRIQAESCSLQSRPWQELIFRSSSPSILQARHAARTGFAEVVKLGFGVDEKVIQNKWLPLLPVRRADHIPRLRGR